MGMGIPRNQSRMVRMIISLFAMSKQRNVAPVVAALYGAQARP